MILVGSRCGGHDFFVELPNKEPIWIGANERSDWDVLVKKREDAEGISLPKMDLWVGGIPGVIGIYREPYSVDGEVVFPEDMAFLQRVAKRRIRHKYGLHFLKSLWGKELNFLNKDGSFFRRVKFSNSFYR